MADGIQVISLLTLLFRGHVRNECHFTPAVDELLSWGMEDMLRGAEMDRRVRRPASGARRSALDAVDAFDDVSRYA